MADMNKKEKKASLWKSIKVGLATLLGMVILAYGFQVTRVNLEELSSEQRQESLIRVMRALAKPDFFEFDQEQVVLNFPIYVPCPADDSILEGTEQPLSGPYIIITPLCAAPGETITVEGFGFAAGASGPLRFVPGSDPDYTVTLGRETVKADPSGHFIGTMIIPNRLSDDVQYIRVTLTRNIGTPHFSQSARDTWEKIVETVFLALLATIFGTILAIPMSFLAARNLMKPVKSPLMSISLSIIGWPAGIAVGFLIVRAMGDVSDMIGSNILINLVSVVASLAVIWWGVRWALPPEEITPPRLALRLVRLLVLALSVVVGFYGSFQLVTIMKTLGASLTKTLGAFGFLGNFLYQGGDIIGVLMAVLGGLAAGGVLSSFLGRIGQRSTERMHANVLKVINLGLTAVAGATLFFLLGQLIEWLYQIGNPLYTLWGPVATGVLLGLLLAAFNKPKDSLPIGLAIYFITRTVLNALRSVEALVMAIVFVIAVGIGPFAGVLALGLHTIVSLAKLYSEQVESIMSGPLEAIQATGANRLQMIVYGVIPQIIPPYISYTMYRWDINVRMSTIIGFVGGGGIGFLLQQNINLLNYRGASAQMVAIAVVVASMDYLSSVMREKTV